jgi:hypothetical protein
MFMRDDKRQKDILVKVVSNIMRWLTESCSKDIGKAEM